MARSSYSRRSNEEHGPVFVILVIAILLSAGLMATQSGDAKLRRAAQAQSDRLIVSPLLSLISRPVRAAEDFLGGWSDRSRAHEENLALRAELQTLREENSRLQVDRMQIASLNEILNVEIETNVPLKRVAARAVNDVTGPFLRALLINEGEGKGIRRGQAVMTADGMVGHVTLTGRNSARVLRLDDLNSRIPVMSERSGSVAILSGDNTSKPKLIFMNLGADWEEGDRVMTSGDDGQLPRGLHIGTVSSVSDDAIRVVVTSFQQPVDWVWVALFEPFVSPELQPVQESDGDDANLKTSEMPTADTGTETGAVTEGNESDAVTTGEGDI
jgi:rod shape-determining protein MreC